MSKKISTALPPHHPSPDIVEISLSNTVQDLANDRCSEAEERCRENITDVYIKNIGYLLITLKYLSDFNIPKARASFATLNELPPSYVGMRRMIIQLDYERVKRIIKLAKDHLKSHARCYLSPTPTTLDVLTNKGFLYNNQFVYQEDGRTIDVIAITEQVHEGALAVQQTSTATKVDTCESFHYIFPSLTRDLVNGEFSTRHPLLRKAVFKTMVAMNHKVEIAYKIHQECNRLNPLKEKEKSPETSSAAIADTGFNSDDDLYAGT